ncbi:MAG: DUF6011 domain-containing protein [Treponema sp.]|nr:DUF6011 domain-containing protein [Treponema sp.]
MENNISSSSICRICKKKLSDITSVKLGIGPVCRGFYGIDGSAGNPGLFDNHAEFDFVDETVSFIYIKDTGHNCTKTVTNDVEWVLQKLSENCKYFDKKRIFYMDSDGKIDEILHAGKTFTGFKAGHTGVIL